MMVLPSLLLKRKKKKLQWKKTSCLRVISLARPMNDANSDLQLTW